MATNQIGIRNSNIIVPYTAATKRTKWLVFDQASGAYSVTSSVANWSVSGRCAVMFYADSSGNWHMRANLRGGFSSGTPTSHDLIFNGVVFKTGTYQSVTVYNAGGTAYGFTNSSASTITVTGNAAANWGISGDVELNAEPTTYTTAANMEGVTAVDVYIPPASAGIAGLVNNAAGNTAGTPILGKTDGVAVASGYVGELVTGVVSSGITINSTPSYIGNGSTTGVITIQPGVYRLAAVINALASDNTTFSVSNFYAISGTCTITEFETGQLYAKPDDAQALGLYQGCFKDAYINVTTTSIVSIRMTFLAGGTYTLASISKFYAVRIA